MLKKIALLLSAVIVILIAIVLVKTIQFSKPIAVKESLAIPALPDSVVSHMQQAIHFKTVSFGSNLPIDSAAFKEFWQFVGKSYPLVTKSLTQQSFNEFSRVFKWEGKHPELKPYVFMAHIDVVPIEKATEKQWTVPAFGGILKNDQIYGRGAADDKACVISILETVEKLLKQGFQPERTIYLSFGHDEEIGGPRGAGTIANWFKENKIHPEVVIDEGGMITKEHFPELKRPIALIGVTEKGYMSFLVSVQLEGGHGSMPVPETAIDILCKALVNLRKKQMPYKILPPLQEMLQRVGPGLSFVQRMAIANQWLFEPILVKGLEKDKGTNAMLRTTIVPTILQAGIKDNVIPGLATATVNTRILPGQSIEEVEAFIKKQMNDDRIVVKRTGPASEDGPPVSIESVAFKKVEAATYQVMKDVIPTPFVMIGGTDSKYFQPIADGVIKFTPGIDPKGFHGVDERINKSDLARMMFFYELLMKDAGR